jgi:hypothetical protein
MQMRSIALAPPQVAPGLFAATRTAPSVEDSQRALARVITIGTQRKPVARSQQRQPQLAALRRRTAVGTLVQQATIRKTTQQRFFAVVCPQLAPKLFVAIRTPPNVEE